MVRSSVAMQTPVKPFEKDGLPNAPPPPGDPSKLRDAGRGASAQGPRSALKRDRASDVEFLSKLVDPKGEVNNMSKTNYEAVKQMAADLINPQTGEWNSAKAIAKNQDRFEQLMRELHEEHEMQLHQILEEKSALETKMHTLIQATWSMSEDGWHGNKHQAEEATLVLLTQDGAEDRDANRPGTTMTAWSTPGDFENPQRQGKKGEVQLRQVWKNEDKKGMQCKKSSIDLTAIENERLRRESLEEEEEKSRMRQNKWIISPFSTRRVVWDMIGLFLLLYDIVMVPLNAFKPDEEIFMVLMEWVTLVFWSADIVASFLTGYARKGRTEMNPCAIAKNYCLGWFPLDILIVVPDWIFTMMALTAEDSAGGSTENVRLLRSFRVVRVLRLLRLAKLQKLLVILKDKFQSELVFKSFNLGLFMIGMVFGVHFGGSLWYLVGDMGLENGEDNWIKASGIQDAPLDYRYFTAMHWSLVNFGLGSMDVQPQNSRERFFAIIMLFTGIFTFAFITAYISNALFFANSTKSEASKQLWLLRRYLRENKVPSALGYRVLRCAEFCCASQKDVLAESKVTILEVLTDQLKEELKFECSYAAHMKPHPLFDKCIQVSDVGVYRLAKAAFDRKSYASKDTIFKDNVRTDYAYIVVDGEILYQKVGSDAEFDLEDPKQVGATDVFCEAALFVNWHTRGEAVVAMDSEVISINVSAFGETIRTDDSLYALVSHYAEGFAEHLNKDDANNWVDVFYSAHCYSLATRFLRTEEEEDMSDARKSFKMPGRHSISRKGGGKLPALRNSEAW